ncbi:MAG TPA: prolyl oligopeptidase family serine peptidase [Pyrinomonadaceae bacterium]|nr:prolyl oligopeptidase family serine peptidase [Pyrinomonadaceae bacterium]
MRSLKILPALALALALCASVSAQSIVPSNDPPASKLSYPEAKKTDHVDEYHGTKVPDPYRWLENSDSPETRQWIEAQNKLTFGYLNQIPERAWIKERLTKLWNFEKVSAPFKRGDRYFIYKNDGLQNQFVLYWMKDLKDTPKVVIDPNKLSADGTVAMAGSSLSEDGKLLAYGLSSGGSDWTEWHVREVETGKDLPDTVKWVKFSGAAWTKDGKGFFYSRFAEPQGDKLSAVMEFQKLYFHRLGTPQSEDVLVYERPDNKSMLFGGFVTEDGRYLVINVSEGSSPKSRIYYKDLSKPDSAVVKLLDKFDAQYSVVETVGDTFYVRTDLDAPLGRVVAIDIKKPEPADWKLIVPEAKETLQGIGTANNQLFASYLKDAYTQVRVYDLNGKFVRNIELPGIGSAGGFGAAKLSDKEFFYSFTSFTVPARVYHYDATTGKSTLHWQPKVDFDPNGYETKQVFYTSKDGTRVPMFITHRKGLKLDGQNPTLLYAYGGFQISQTPGFSVSNLIWMEMGGVYAVANIRGGGEYGKAWHEAAIKSKRQNAFDDFIAAGEWLISNKYTTNKKLAVMGGSNGGLLVGVVLNQRPDLFGAALPAVGVMDMLRFHKFTIGRAWVSDFGSADDAEEFKHIYAYSPLHNIKAGAKYPAVLITTADHDDRVVPLHSFKYAAALQAAQGGDAPVLIRIETRAGHGAGKPTAKIIEEVADRWGFLVRNLGVSLPQANRQQAAK